MGGHQACPRGLCPEQLEDGVAIPGDGQAVGGTGLGSRVGVSFQTH